MKLSQAEIKTKADEWAVLRAKLDKLEAARVIACAVFQAQFDEATREINDAHEAKAGSLREKAAAIESEILGALKAIDKPIVLQGNLAEAVNETKIGRRTADPRKFFKLAKDKFFDCVTVGIAKAEMAIGKDALDKICDKPKTLVASLRLRAGQQK